MSATIMTVVVDGTTHKNICAVGIGHIRADLVVVPRNDDGSVGHAHELGTGWTRVEIVRESV